MNLVHSSFNDLDMIALFTNVLTFFTSGINGVLMKFYFAYSALKILRPFVWICHGNNENKF